MPGGRQVDEQAFGLGRSGNKKGQEKQQPGRKSHARILTEVRKFQRLVRTSHSSGKNT